MSLPIDVSFSSAALRDAAQGLAQQMVLWGHDVRHPSGNLLVRFGMERTASSGLTGTSCYSTSWQGGRIELHGAVASWTAADDRPGCVFCRDRGRIELWLGERAPVPGKEFGISGSHRERWEAFQPFLCWLCAYEFWVLETVGEAWRSGAYRALKRLPMGKPWLPPASAREWWQLALSGQPPRAKSLSI